MANLSITRNQKRVLEATVETFCKIDPPLASDKSWKV